MTNLWCQGLNIQETCKSQGCASCSSQLCVFPQWDVCPWVRSVGTSRITLKQVGMTGFSPDFSRFWYMAYAQWCLFIAHESLEPVCTLWCLLRTLIFVNLHAQSREAKSTGGCSCCTAALEWKLPVSLEKGSRAPSSSSSLHPRTLNSSTGSHLALAELCSDLSIPHKVVSAKDGSGGRRRWQMPPQTHKYTPHGLDWQEFQTQDVRSGETQPVSEDHSLPQPLNPQKGLGTKVSHFLRFSVHPEHTNTCIV